MLERSSSSIETSHQLSANAQENETLEGSRRRSGGQAKRKAASNSPSSSSAPAKRLAKERAALIQNNGPCTRARQSPNNKFPATTIAKPEETQMSRDASEAAADETALKLDTEDQSPEPPLVDTELEAVRSRDPNSHIVPVPAGWFSWTKIHPLEKQTLSSFFNGKSVNHTPETYLEVRNLIMKKYHANPQSEISLNDLSEIKVGEDKAKKEIMEFLGHWGLINFHPFPPPDTVADTEKVDETVEDASLIDKLYQFRMHPLTKVGLQKVSFASTPLPRILPESAIPDVFLPPEGPSVEYHCNSCSADCSRKRYHCQKQADFDLCPECYNDGKFGSGMISADFILMEPVTEISGTSSGSWTDQETLLLLEALELYGENWDEIAEHVATKTKVQCFLHFVRMPIEDMFLDSEVTSGVTKPEVPDVAAEEKDPPPLETSSDPPETAPEGAEPPNDAPQQPKAAASVSSPVKHANTDGRPSSPPSDTVTLNYTGLADDARETVDKFAIDALKAAFQAVGAPCMQGVSVSFAEAGNPVMALVSYLAALVDSDTCDASVGSSLRAICENSPGIQLSSRHCFFLEDPPDGCVDVGSCKSVVDVEFQKEDTIVPKGTEESTVITTNNNEAGVQEATDASVASKECEKKSHVTIESSEFSDREAISSVETKTLDVDSTPVHPEMHDSSGTLNPEQTDETCLGAVKNVMTLTVTAHETNTTCKLENEVNDSKITSKPNVVSIEQKGVSAKIKRAAVATLSAAAVKAKLLANQEEEQIREVCSFVIERQLQKLEVKLSLLSDLERAYMRVREQIDRARQRLMLERNQIIAARLGLPTCIPRAGSQVAPSNRSSGSIVNNVATRAVGSTPPLSQDKGQATVSSASVVPGSLAGGLERF